MDPFKLLTVGASFSRSKKAAAKKGSSAAPTARRGQDVEALFHKSVRVQLDESGSEEEGASEASDDDTAAGEPSGSVLPKELDFFGVGSGGGGAKAEGASKKRKRKTTTVAARSLPPTNRLSITGPSAPTALASLDEFIALHSPPSYVIQNLRAMGITQMSEIGRGAAAVMMADRDLLALAPTGSGKTLGYLLPLLTLLKTPAKAAAAAATADGAESSSDEEDRDGSEDDQPSSSRAATAKVSPRAIILSPTHELAQQIASETLKLTQGRKWRIAVLTKANELSIVERGADVLICTPQRLVAAIECRGLSLAQTKHLIIDESDRLLDKTFLPVVDTILTALTDRALRRALFTATLPSDLEEIAKGMGTGESIRVIVGMKDIPTASIKQELVFTGTETGKLLALRQHLTTGALVPPILVFVQSIERATSLFHELIYDALPIEVIHSERTPKERERVLRDFREGKVWVLICTELIGRGMDFRGVRAVVNYDFPTSVQSYVHRIGRTGRAGQEGKAVTFFNNEDAPYLKMVANVMRQSGCEVPEWMLALKNPSKKERRKLKSKPVDRMGVQTAAGSGIKRQEATKRREMVEGSKRRKLKAAAQEGGSDAAGSGGDDDDDDDE